MSRALARIDFEQLPYHTPEERAARGKSARARLPRSRHGEWAPAAKRIDPVKLLEIQGESRVPDLVPLRYGRMASSAFAFFRGAADIFAADMGAEPQIGLEAQICGDAHLANFGGFGTPERTMLFDVNDFDETSRGPFEWDVKRLAASLEIAGRGRGFDAKEREAIVEGSVSSYRHAMRDFATMRNLDVWYARMDMEEIGRRWGPEASHRMMKRFQQTIEKGQSKDRFKALAKLTHLVDGEPRFRSDPPLLVPASELGAKELRHFEDRIKRALKSYGRTLSGNRRRLLESYRFADLARKVVGVGSVGTRCWVLLMLGLDNDDPLFLQVKQAEVSVLEPYAGKSKFANHGQRVVEGQRVMQASSDIFLGWDVITAPDGKTHDFYIRQLWDWKVSADIENMVPDAMRIYGEICGWTLARAHARSGERVAIASYLGSSAAFDRAIGRFARLYADQNELDHQALVDAIARGRLKSMILGG